MIDMEFRKTEHPSVRQGGWIRSRVFASILSATLLMSPISSLGFELNAGRIPFEGDKSVCQAFTSYFRHEAELIARERAEGREGISVHSYLTTRRDSWGGISVPELPKADSEYADSNAIGYQLGDALGSHEQASQMFKADLFQNGDIRTVLITTEDSQRPRSSILILKPNKHLKVFAFQNAFYPEMTVASPVVV